MSITTTPGIERQRAAAQNYRDGYKAGHFDRVIRGEANDYSAHADAPGLPGYKQGDLVDMTGATSGEKGGHN